MLIVRYVVPGTSTPEIGMADAGQVRSLPVATMGQLLRLTLAELHDLCSRTPQPTGVGRNVSEVRLLPPVDGMTEVWAAGVTYEVSKDERMLESSRAATVYDLVYAADRPELFFKSAAWRVVGSGEYLAVRADSSVDVPEPELALVINAWGEIVGYTVCNDMSSRSIEGQNPLYLPQAKIYLGGCAVANGFRPAWEVGDPYALTIGLRIHRAGGVVWEGTASTASLVRRFGDLAGWLTREDRFPDGVLLATGTSLVPSLPFSLTAGDVVAISVQDVGVLANEIVAGKAQMEWLVAARDQPASRPVSPAAVSAAGELDPLRS